MKKILFLLASIFCLNSFSQITVIDTSKSIKIGEVTQVGVPIIDCFKEDNKYTFKYYNNINKANNEYKKFSIINLDNDFEKLFNLINDGFKKKENHIIKIQTTENILGLEFIRAFNVTAFRFIQFDENENMIGYSIALSNKQIKKLFGK